MEKNLILIKHPKNWGLDKLMVEISAKKALVAKKLTGIELSLIFVGRKRAKELNIKYRNMDYVPQVLGFPMSKDSDDDGVIRLGDIVICTQKLKYEAKFLHKSIVTICDEWIKHGLENLLKD